MIVSSTYGLIPAAGKSRRMGRQKLTLPWKGQTVLQCAVAAMTQGGVATVVVVIGPGENELRTLAERAGADVLELAESTAEMRDTIERGLDWIERRHRPAPGDGCLLLPADHPSLEKEVVQQILAARPLEAGPSIVVPTFEDRRGHPVWISWRHVPGIRKLPQGIGLNIYLRQHAKDTLYLSVSATSILWDLDTPVDLTTEPKAMIPLAAHLTLGGTGWPLQATPRYPAGNLRGGGYDVETNTLFLGGGSGHPIAVREAGGDPSKSTISGITVFERQDGAVFWANDSASLPRLLSPSEVQSVQQCLESYYVGRPVGALGRLGDVPKLP